MKNKTYLTLLMCLFLCSFNIFAQSPLSKQIIVKGIVIDSLTREPISYATLRVTPLNKPNLLEKAVVTEDNGKFSFPINKKGDFVLSIQYLGKDPTSKEFTVGGESTIDLGTIILRDNKTSLSEVVVTAQRPLVKVDMEKLTYNIEDDPDSKTNTVMDMLRKVPMVTVDGEDNIQLKGSGSYKIYVDGKPSPMLANNPKDVLKSMPASSIKNIEVITDPGAKYDAEGLAGIINIITNKQTTTDGYTTTLSARTDTRGGYGLGAFLTLKKGKIGFTGNYNYYNFKRPWVDGNSSYRETFNESKWHTMQSMGGSKYNGDGQFGSGELSYEIDTLNLVNVSFNMYGGKGVSESRNQTSFIDKDAVIQQAYDQYMKSEYTYGQTTLSADYQRTSAKNKNRTLTVSYRYQTSPNDWSSYSEYNNINITKFSDAQSNQYSDGQTQEHTAQLDFTTPIAKIHTLETGLKYISRLSKSNSGRENFNLKTEDWDDAFSDNDKFKHQQDIYSAYVGYGVRLKKWGFKTGLRYERTDLDVKFPINSDLNFKTHYQDVVPSLTMSYQLKPTQSFRLGYNMRISRPGIWQLNPYVNTSDTTSISYGNPDLDAVKLHNINLNYSLFTPKFNINTSLSYNFVNNSIEDITKIDGNVIERTYANVGRRRELSLFNYISWSIVSSLKITMNLSGSYVKIKGYGTPNEWLTNDGFNANLFSNIQYTLPYDFKLSAGFGGMTKTQTLLGTRGGYNYNMIGLSKSFLNDKLSFNVRAINPFQKELKFKSEELTSDYLSRSINVNKNRFFGFSVSYRFGEMKTQIKKAQRSIVNDDAMSGGGNESGGQAPAGN